MTIQEIEEFVQRDLADLNLSTKEKNAYISFIKKLDDYYIIHHIHNIYAHNLFLQKLDECIEFFITQGFDEETATELAKKAVLESDRKDFKVKLSLLRVLNFEESVIKSDSLSLRFNLEKTHAKKMYLVVANNTEAQTRNFLIHDGDDRVKKRFKVEMNQLTQKYRLTKETIEVWMIIATMKDAEFENYFKMTRQELSYIYPTTKEELTVLNFIANLTDEEIIERYGISRKELLAKYPLNNDTLKALKSIKLSSDKAIESTFHKSRQELLQLRTITTDMIRIAQKEKLILKRKTYTKEELREQFKIMKKGTHPNG